MLSAAAIVQRINLTLAAWCATIPIGGYDRDSVGSGFLYENDISAIVRGAYPGLYDVEMSTPAEGTAIAILYGSVIVPFSFNITVTVVP